jgi:hypothetical protein
MRTVFDAPFEAKPAQRGEELQLVFVPGARLVRILDPQQQPPFVLAGEGEIEQGDIGRAHVGCTGGRRSDTDANLVGHKWGAILRWLVEESSEGSRPKSTRANAMAI